MKYVVGVLLFSGNGWNQEEIKFDDYNGFFYIYKKHNCSLNSAINSEMWVKRNNILLIISINEKITIYTDGSTSGSCSIAYNQA